MRFSAFPAAVLNDDAPPPSRSSQYVLRPTSRGKIISQDHRLGDVLETIDRVARSSCTVLVTGESGTGKELVVAALHDASTRKTAPLVTINCGAIPNELVESELFGHAKGAFTGAQGSRRGLVAAAEGGTLFLDEVGELPLELQPKLLRVLERREVVRVGENKPRPANVRVVAATWRDLRRMVNQGQFRDDLYFRLAQARIVLPSLSERREDIELLVAEFLRRLPRNMPCARSVSQEALFELVGREYPGNVRELKNTVERAAYMCDGPVIRPQDLAFDRLLERGGGRDPGERAAALAPPEDGLLPEFKGAKRTAVDDFEQAYLARLMGKTGGNITTAASLAGIERHYLRSLLKKHGLHTPHE